MIFSSFSKSANKHSKYALAVALATTGVLASTAIATPAQAQRAKQEKKAAKESEGKNYSKEFVAVYQPLAQQVEAGGDVAALKGQLPTLTAAAQTADDRYVAGNMILQVGQKSQDQALQKQGLEMMLESGKVPAANVGQYNAIAGGLAYDAKDFTKARQYFEAAMAAGYNENEPQALIAETYFQGGQNAEGLAYLKEAIDARKAAGQPVSEAWIKRGMSVAYNNKMPAETSDYARMFIANNPTPANWADVIVIEVTGQNYANPELLDLMRLAREANALRDERSYADYVDAADYRKLPGEVLAVIDEGKAAGKIPASSQFMNDLRGQAVSRAAADKKDLPGILKGAQNASDVATITSGADLALSYGDYPAAEMLYKKAMGMPGANADLIHTRLGIAQLEQGKAAEAKTHFDMVKTGPRASVAQLWSIYADQQGG